MTRIDRKPPTTLSPYAFGPRERAFRVFCRGLKQQNIFNHKEAVKHFERAHRLDPTLILAKYEKAWSLVAVARYAEAAEAIRGVVKQYQELGENFSLVENFELYRKDIVVERGYLDSLYENIMMLNALLAVGKDRRLAQAHLIDMLKDPLIHDLSKEIICRFVDGLNNMERHGHSRAMLRSFSSMAMYLGAMMTNINRLILSVLESVKDYHAVGNTLRSQLLVLEPFLGRFEFVSKFKSLMLITLAENHLKLGAPGESRRIVEDLLEKEPHNTAARNLLQKLERMN